MTSELEARDRLRCYSRRWRVARNATSFEDSAYDWLQCYLRRMRVIDRRPLYEAPRLTFIATLEQLQWIPTEGEA